MHQSKCFFFLHTRHYCTIVSNGGVEESLKYINNCKIKNFKRLTRNAIEGEDRRMKGCFGRE